MKTSNKPKLVTPNSVPSFNVLQVTGQANIIIPLDHKTKEVVVIVVEESALLKIDEKEHLLEKGIHLLFKPVKPSTFAEKRI